MAGFTALRPAISGAASDRERWRFWCFRAMTACAGRLGRSKRSATHREPQVTIMPIVVNVVIAFIPLLLFNAGVSQAKWRSEYANVQPRIAEYFEFAQSKRGGNCCKWADGYILGKEYPNIYSSGDKQYHTRIVFLKWEMRPDGYHATIWDAHTDGYIDLRADYDASAPGNPTGVPVVWIWHNPITTKVEIRCYGDGSGT
jgi:hypothetical protein